jgi:hypothetical protein
MTFALRRSAICPSFCEKDRFDRTPFVYSPSVSTGIDMLITAIVNAAQRVELAELAASDAAQPHPSSLTQVCYALSPGPGLSRRFRARH